MPVGGLLLLLDDIAATLDDVAVMTKIAGTKTAGVLGDDLALNVQQVAGVRAERELPVVWSVAKGSAWNKAILVPAALATSAYLPWAVLPLMMAGGTYLCFEGVEKLAHKAPRAARQPTVAGTGRATEQVASVPDPDPATAEQSKIKAAIRTDFVLSAEIITITLGTVAGVALAKQFAVLVAVSVVMTVGVYGLVAGIVRIDDLGRYLVNREDADGSARLLRRLGRSMLIGVPYLMKALSVLGTAAMFLVGGGILTHGIPGANDQIQQHLVGPASGIPVVGGLLGSAGVLLADAALGVIAGVAALSIVNSIRLVLRAAGVLERT